MVYPPQLKQGDSIALVAPAGKLVPGSIAKAVEEATSWGLAVVPGRHVYARHNTFAGTDAARLEDLQWALDDPGIKAVFCARGGYGVTRILDQIDFTLMTQQPKWIVGFSDITALHLYLQKLSLASVHGPMGTSLGRPEYEVSSAALRKLLFGQPVPDILGKGGRAGSGHGPITGGNLSLLVDSLGTANEIETAGKVLFIEEIGEKTYRLDRMLHQLLRAGKLTNLAGLVLGHFTAIDDGDAPFGIPWQEVILEITGQFSYPVGFGFALGHEPQNMPVVMGGEYRLVVQDSQASLTWLPPA